MSKNFEDSPEWISSSMKLGLSSHPIISAMSIAPSGIATPSDQQSMKSSQQSFHVPTPKVFWNGTHTPLEPRPSTETSRASTMIASATNSTIFLRAGSLPCATRLSMK